MGNVGEERAEGDDQLDPELLARPDDLAAEGPPARVRLDPEEQDGVTLGSGRLRRHRGAEERVLRPVDAPCHSFFERHVRTHGLEVEELLRVDVGEPLRVPGAGQDSRRRAMLPARRRSSPETQRRAPAGAGRDGCRCGGARRSAECTPALARQSPRQRPAGPPGTTGTAPRRSAVERGEPGRPDQPERDRDEGHPDQRSERHVNDDDTPGKLVSPLALADPHLDEEQPRVLRTRAGARPGRCADGRRDRRGGRGSRSRRRH